MRIGIYGGSFSPVHNGHVAAAKAFMEQMWLDVLYIMPVGIPPHKQIDAADDPAHRFRMCELAFRGMRNVIVSDIEITREGRSYTVDTLRALAGEDRRLFLLCGTDMMLTLDRWRSPEEIFKLSYPVYIRRDNDRTLDDVIIQKIAEYNEKYGKVMRKIVTEPIELSSESIRARLANGVSISDLVPAAVEKYIIDKHLYV